MGFTLPMKDTAKHYGSHHPTISHDDGMLHKQRDHVDSSKAYSTGKGGQKVGSTKPCMLYFLQYPCFEIINERGALDRG